jgi:DNA uptake protein ComE-like DNA-binding protein
MSDSGPIQQAQPRVSRRQVLAGAASLVVALPLTGRAAFAQTPTPSLAASPAATPAATMTKINLNTATDEQILAVPGTGSRFLREFKEYRPYTSITQFRLQLGKYVSQDQVAAWEKYVYVPVDPNKADKETLEQIPGITDAIAQKLIDGRSYASNDAFLKALGSYLTPAQVKVASAYLVQS